MSGLLTYIIIFAAIGAFIAKASKQTNQSNSGQQNQARTPQVTGQVRRNPQPTRTTNANRSLAGMKDGDVERPTRIENRRKEQQANADRTRIHQEIHQKEVQQKLEEERLQKAMEAGLPHLEFEEHDLMKEVEDLMVCGYPTTLENQRDFISEGVDFLNRFQA
ncbi:MAG: hypothetical protein K6G04_04635 [Lachnospiraceae bacterium]|nr:hypothetical protein [Lachnospiraceae bacterium]